VEGFRRREPQDTAVNGTAAPPLCGVEASAQQKGP